QLPPVAFEAVSGDRDSNRVKRGRGIEALPHLGATYPPTPRTRVRNGVPAAVATGDRATRPDGSRRVWPRAHPPPPSQREIRSAHGSRSGSAASIAARSKRLVGPCRATIAASPSPALQTGAATAESPTSRSSIASAYPAARTRSISSASAVGSTIVFGVY